MNKSDEGFKQTLRIEDHTKIQMFNKGGEEVKNKKFGGRKFKYIFLECSLIYTAKIMNVFFCLKIGRPNIK